jgi:hypothetical protein
MMKVAVIPDPLRPTEVGEVGALLTIETFPFVDPTDVGWKATVIVVCWPALTLIGSVNPLTVKPVPVGVTWVMFNVALPVLLTIKACDVLLPTTTFPKLMEVGLT